MKVIIVFPGRGIETAKATAAVMPLAPCLLAALTSDEHDVSLVDMFLGDQVDYESDVDVVAITVRTPRSRTKLPTILSNVARRSFWEGHTPSAVKGMLNVGRVVTAGLGELRPHKAPSFQGAQQPERRRPAEASTLGHVTQMEQLALWLECLDYIASPENALNQVLALAVPLAPAVTWDPITVTHYGGEIFTRLQRRLDSVARNYHRSLKELQRLQSDSQEIGFVPSSADGAPSDPAPQSPGARSAGGDQGAGGAGSRPQKPPRSQPQPSPRRRRHQPALRSKIVRDPHRPPRHKSWLSIQRSPTVRLSPPPRCHPCPAVRLSLWNWLHLGRLPAVGAK